jgi:hypothetical protein
MLFSSKIAKINELKEVLGTSSTMTVFRTLSATGYLTSYSHRGGYYTLPDIPDFDLMGLWTYRSAKFSQHGNLLDTVAALVEQSESGRTVAELDMTLHVETKHAALRLLRKGALARSIFGGVFVYLSMDAGARRRQELMRDGCGTLRGLAVGVAAKESHEELKAAIILFFSLLDERQRRFYAGLESSKPGHGGDQRLAELLGMDPHTVAKGRHELLGGTVERGRMRAKGGGRMRTEKKKPSITAAIESILESTIAGDPMSERRWTHETAGKVAACLAENFSVKVSATTVGRLLGEMAYSLKSNKKCISSGSSPGRGTQFGIITRLRQDFAAHGAPVISVDTKKKELIGRFKNAGRTWCREAKKVKDHDFRSEALGIASPYGIFDPQRNFGTLVVGQSADTPEFAVNCILTWWRMHGREHYPDAKQLLILADSGGSNGARPKMWKKHLQEKIADGCGLTVTVAHYPSGASKWNPIEHRMFSEISKNWAGVPLESFDTVVNYAKSTTTENGLRVAAYRDEREYAKGTKATKTEMRSMAVTVNSTLGNWNYTIAPRPEGIGA